MVKKLADIHTLVWTRLLSSKHLRAIALRPSFMKFCPLSLCCLRIKSLPVEFYLISSLDGDHAGQRVTYDFPAKLKITYKQQQFKSPAPADTG